MNEPRLSVRDGTKTQSIIDLMNLNNNPQAPAATGLTPPNGGVQSVTETLTLPSFSTSSSRSQTKVIFPDTFRKYDVLTEAPRTMTRGGFPIRETFSRKPPGTDHSVVPGRVAYVSKRCYNCNREDFTSAKQFSSHIKECKRSAGTRVGKDSTLIAQSLARTEDQAKAAIDVARAFKEENDVLREALLADTKSEDVDETENTIITLKRTRDFSDQFSVKWTETIKTPAFDQLRLLLSGTLGTLMFYRLLLRKIDQLVVMNHPVSNVIRTIWNCIPGIPVFDLERRGMVLKHFLMLANKIIGYAKDPLGKYDFIKSRMSLAIVIIYGLMFVQFRKKFEYKCKSFESRKDDEDTRPHSLSRVKLIHDEPKFARLEFSTENRVEVVNPVSVPARTISAIVNQVRVPDLVRENAVLALTAMGISADTMHEISLASPYTSKALARIYDVTRTVADCAKSKKLSIPFLRTKQENIKVSLEQVAQMNTSLIHYPGTTDDVAWERIRFATVNMGVVNTDKYDYMDGDHTIAHSALLTYAIHKRLQRETSKLPFSRPPAQQQ